jgi:hypothetical protein
MSPPRIGGGVFGSFLLRFEILERDGIGLELAVELRVGEHQGRVSGKIERAAGCVEANVRLLGAEQRRVDDQLVEIWPGPWCR